MDQWPFYLKFSHTSALGNGNACRHGEWDRAGRATGGRQAVRSLYCATARSGIIYGIMAFSARLSNKPGGRHNASQGEMMCTEAMADGEIIEGISRIERTISTYLEECQWSKGNQRKR